MLVQLQDFFHLVQKGLIIVNNQYIQVFFTFPRLVFIILYRCFFLLLSRLFFLTGVCGTLEWSFLINFEIVDQRFPTIIILFFQNEQVNWIWVKRACKIMSYKYSYFSAFLRRWLNTIKIQNRINSWCVAVTRQWTGYFLLLKEISKLYQNWREII